MTILVLNNHHYQQAPLSERERERETAIKDSYA